MIPASVSHTNAEGSDPRLPKDVQEQRPMSDQKSPANTLVMEDNEDTAVFCERCRTWFNSPTQFEEHRTAGKKHKKNYRKDGTKTKVNGLEDVEDKEVTDDGTTVEPSDVFDINTTPRLPEGYCQLCITHPAYSTPLLWVCTKMESLMAVIARWSHPHHLRLLQAIPPQLKRKGSVYLLMYTIPPRKEPNFLSQLYWEMFEHTQRQQVHIAFDFFPPAPCTECRSLGRLGEILPKPECEICYERPSFHHTQCCPNNDNDLNTFSPASPTDTEGMSQGY